MQEKGANHEAAGGFPTDMTSDGTVILDSQTPDLGDTHGSSWPLVPPGPQRSSWRMPDPVCGISPLPKGSQYPFLDSFFLSSMTPGRSNSQTTVWVV